MSLNATKSTESLGLCRIRKSGMIKHLHSEKKAPFPLAILLPWVKFPGSWLLVAFQDNARKISDLQSDCKHRIKFEFKSSENIGLGNQNPADIPALLFKRLMFHTFYHREFLCFRR